MLYHLLVQLIFVLQRIEETSTLCRVEGNTRNKPNRALQRSLVHDKLQENIARITWPYQLEAKMASYKQFSLKDKNCEST